MTAVEGREKPGWAIERRIPVMLFLLLGVQIGTALIWAGSMGERVGRLEAVSSVQTEMAERLVRQEEKLRHALESLARIEQKLDRMQGG